MWCGVRARSAHYIGDPFHNSVLVPQVTSVGTREANMNTKCVCALWNGRVASFDPWVGFFLPKPYHPYRPPCFLSQSLRCAHGERAALTMSLLGQAYSSTALALSGVAAGAPCRIERMLGAVAAAGAPPPPTSEHACGAACRARHAPLSLPYPPYVLTTTPHATCGQRATSSACAWWAGSSPGAALFPGVLVAECQLCSEQVSRVLRGVCFAVVPRWRTGSGLKAG